jgi:hypothetical protein
MYNVTLRRVREIVVDVEKQYVLIIGLCVHACACVQVVTRARGRVHAHTCIYPC